MRTRKTFDTRLANAGLLAGVGIVWALLLLQGDLNGTWLLAGFMTVGLGMLAIGAIERVAGRGFAGRGSAGRGSAGASSEDETEQPAGKEPDAAADNGEAEVVTGARTWVLMVASCLEASAIGLVAGHYSGSVIVLVAAGVIAGGVAVAISLLLARKMTTV